MLPGLAADPSEVANYQASQSWAFAGFFILLIGAALVLRWAKQNGPDLAMFAIVALAISGFLGGQILMLGTENYGRYRSGLPLVPTIEAELAPGMKLYAVGLYDQTLPFYLRRTMILVEHADELEFGLQQEPHLWLPTREAFIEQWTKGPKGLAITRPEIFADLQKRGVPMRVVTQDSRRIVISNDLKMKALK
jgi:hypothetical protein